MDKPTKFSIADHTLINAAAEMGVSRVSDKRYLSVMDDILATFRDVLPVVTRENRLIGDLAQACDEIVEHYDPAKISAPMHAAQFHLAAALGTLFRWKHAQALRAFQEQGEAV